MRVTTRPVANAVVAPLCLEMCRCISYLRVSMILPLQEKKVLRRTAASGFQAQDIALISCMNWPFRSISTIFFAYFSVAYKDETTKDTVFDVQLIAKETSRSSHYSYLQRIWWRVSRRDFQINAWRLCVDSNRAEGYESSVAFKVMFKNSLF